MAQKEVELHIEKEKTVVHHQTALAKSVILELFTSDNTVIDVPFRPKWGSLYIVKTNEKSKNDWKADGYAWTNQGTKSLPRKDPKYRKSYFYIKDKDGKPNAGFRKDVFFPLAKDTAQQICIVHYIGKSRKVWNRKLCPASKICRTDVGYYGISTKEISLPSKRHRQIPAKQRLYPKCIAKSRNW